MLIKKKLGEYKELLLEELECEVNSRVHDACAVCAYRVGHVSYVDCVQVLVVTGPLHKYL